MRTRMFLLAALSVAGCHGTTDVKVLSPTTFSVSAQFGSLTGSWDRAKEEASQKAKDFCAARNQTASITREEGAGVLGITPQSVTVFFTCGLLVDSGRHAQ
jgi:hypothetical protein